MIQYEVVTVLITNVRVRNLCGFYTDKSEALAHARRLGRDIERKKTHKVLLRIVKQVSEEIIS